VIQPASLRRPGEGVRALLFDLGGVLMDIDFDRVLGAWSAAARCDPAELRARFAFDDAYRQHERGEIQAPEYFASLRRSLGLTLSDDEFLDGWGRLYAGVIEPVPALLAAAAQRFPLYAFTNSNPAHQAVWSIRFARELECFRSVFVSSELGLRKPDPAAFAAVCQQLRLRPDQVMFFDDTAENVAGAEQAGMTAVLIRSAGDVQSACARLGIGLRH
jgi:putative hydrolase of the HAD superfamily